MADTDDSVEHGVLITAKWEWTNGIGAGRWTNPQQGIKPKRAFIPTIDGEPFNDFHGIWFSKLKIRGHGKSLVLRFESEDGKDFQIMGWSIPFTADTVV